MRFNYRGVNLSEGEYAHGEGELDDHSIACPRHGAKFDIRTGAPLTMPATEPTRSYPVKVDGGDVYVNIG